MSTPNPELPQRDPFIGPPVAYSGAPPELVEQVALAVREWAGPAIAPCVRRLLDDFHRETQQKLDLAPIDSRPIFEGADGSLLPVDADGWISDSDADPDRADAITIQPTDVRDIEES
ncbi:hypothetical protein [Nocardia pseudovaccinii]|uniref:hypothetical protein n=1 Tax=Nocardia pseudovaccinii TaxID=189540 RepID=UPI0007A46F14|nr:hypothetical protein [Nocardia pseudovaccinii]